MKPSRNFEDLVALMDRLRGPDGCAWDRAQTWETLRGFLLEECHETAEAIDDRDPGALRGELGDLLFQIVFLARIAKEEGQFDASDVVLGISEKMLRRHPHVFSDARADSADEVLRQWERIKRAEKGDDSAAAPPSALDGLPRALPALLAAHRLGDKASRVGFDWPDARSVLEKVGEEMEELRAAVAGGDVDAIREELGDTLFALAMLGRKLEVDPEGALASANRKFRNRFVQVEELLRREGAVPEDAGLERLESLWNRVKEAERGT